jgi:hypothetical protein
LFGGVADKYGATLNFVKDRLPKADMKIPFRTYLSMTLLFGVIIYFASFATIIIVRK